MKFMQGMPANARLGLHVDGYVAEGFGAVREAFVANLQDRGEIGAACAVWLEGEPVVDLWGGLRDGRAGLAWEEPTLVLMFSVTKGMSAIAVAKAVSQGLLSLDERIATYWPEFAVNGKEQITVRQVLAHQSGVSTVDEPLTPEVMADPTRIAALIERQRPLWRPGTRQGYHFLTVGWISDQLIRRVAPGRPSLSRYYQDEIAAPLGLEFHIGLPEAVPPERVARIHGFHGARMLLHPRTMPARMLLSFFVPGSLTARTLGNPKMSSPADFDRPTYRRLALPAASGIGEVRGVAKAFGELASGAPRLGIAPEVLDELSSSGREPADGYGDLVWRRDLRFSLGFIKPSPDFTFGSSGRAFGSEGAGGSFAFADPDLALGFAYAPNRLGFHLMNDPREQALRQAVYACV